MDNHIFRTAISGFNRQDVTEYIERTQKQAEDAIAAKEEQLEALRKENEDTRLELDQRTLEVKDTRRLLEERIQDRDGLAKQLEEMTRRCEDAQSNCDAQSQAKESFRREVSERDAAIREMTEEKQRLLRQMEDLQAQLDDMRRQKEQLAQLELEARQRADGVLAGAEAQAKRVQADAAEKAEAVTARAKAQAESILAQAEKRSDTLLRETQEWIGAAAARYDRFLRVFVDASIRVTEEARKLEAAAQLPATFDQVTEGLEELRERAKDPRKPAGTEESA